MSALCRFNGLSVVSGEGGKRENLKKRGRGEKGNGGTCFGRFSLPIPTPGRGKLGGRGKKGKEVCLPGLWPREGK